MIAPIFLALTTPAAVPAPTPAPACTSAVSTDRVDGRWTGPFAGND